MKDIYMIIFDDESDFLITTEPEQMFVCML